jgi:hypothetical protein
MKLLTKADFMTYNDKVLYCSLVESKVVLLHIIRDITNYSPVIDNEKLDSVYIDSSCDFLDDFKKYFNEQHGYVLNYGDSIEYNRQGTRGILYTFNFDTKESFYVNN